MSLPLTITIDTEADCSKSWRGRTPESYSNLHALREKLAPVTERFGAPCTLLLNGDIIAREEPSQRMAELRRDFGWELGTHLHGEFVEPQRQHASPAGVLLRDFQCAYPFELERAKLTNLTRDFTARFGTPPTSFRAGRFGAGPSTFRILAELGYRVDTSVVPRAWLREEGQAADFRSFSHFPVQLVGGAGSLLELPVTVRPPRFLGLEYGRHGGLLQRLVDHLKARLIGWLPALFAPTWLRPSFASAAQMRRLLHWLLRDAERFPVANIMFHSNELLAGASPYNDSEAEVDAFLGRLADCLQEARRLGFRFANLSEAAELAAQRPCPTRPI